MAGSMGEIKKVKNAPVLKSLQESVLKCGAEQVANAIGKHGKAKRRHFYAEMNPNSDQQKAKLSLDDAIEATRVTGNVTWIEMLAAEFGYNLTIKNAHPNKDTVSEELNDDLEHLSEFSRVCRESKLGEKEIRAASLALRLEIQQTEELAIRTRREKKKFLHDTATDNDRRVSL